MPLPPCARRRFIPVLGAILGLSGAGCANYYYPMPGACGPAPVVSSDPCTTVYGPNTQPPAGSAVVVGGSEPGLVSRTGRAPRVVVSTPGDSGPRLSWRRNDSEDSLATTKVDGALDSTVK